MSRVIRVDPPVYALAVAGKAEREAQEHRVVSLSDGLRRAINNAGLALIHEHAAFTDHRWAGWTCELGERHEGCCPGCTR